MPSLIQGSPFVTIDGKSADLPSTISDEQIDHPKHYTSHPSGVEAIVICEHMSFCVGNAIKYLLRAGHKGREIEDLKKARWYCDREISRLEKEKSR